MKIQFIIAIVLISSSLFGQQKINYIDGSSEEVKIVEVGEKDIKYIPKDNLEGPVYSISKKDVISLTLSDGSTKQIQSENKMITSDSYYPNMLNFHLLDIAFEDFTFSYERIFRNGHLGIQIPFGFGFQQSSYYYGYNNLSNTFYSGFALNYYPAGQKKWTYYVGPEFRFGYFENSYNEWVWDPTFSYEYQKKVEIHSNYAKMYVRNGVMFTPVKSLSLAANFGLGIQQYAIEGYFEITAHGAINISYRF